VDAASWGFVGTLLGAFVGATSSIAATAISSRNAFRLQQSTKEYERAELARAFQRETLLSVQEAVQDLMRSVAKVHLADEAAFRETKQWGVNQLPDDLAENYRILSQRAHALAVRIADDSLREKIQEVRAKAGCITSAKSYTDATEQFTALTFEYTRTMEHLGSVLRTTY